MPNPKSTAQIAGHPIHPMLIPFPIAAFVATLVTDIALRSGGNDFWHQMGVWLLSGGLIFAALAALTGMTDALGDERIRSFSDTWLHAGANIIAVVLELINLYLRYQNGPAFTAGTGLWISAGVVLLLLFSGWKGGELVYKKHVGVSD